MRWANSSGFAAVVVGLALFPGDTRALVGGSGAPVATPGVAPVGAQGSHAVLTLRAGAVGEVKGGRFRLVRVETGAEKGARKGGEAAGAAARAGAGARAVAVVGIESGAGGGDVSAAFTELSSLAKAWSAAHPQAQLLVRRQRDRIEVAASGPNPLGALTAFLATLDLRLDRWGALAAFVGIAVGTETDGASLGIANRDPDTRAPLGVTLLSLQESAGTPEARLDLLLPPHLLPTRLEAPLRERTAAFTRRSGVPIEFRIYPRP